MISTLKVQICNTHKFVNTINYFPYTYTLVELPPYTCNSDKLIKSKPITIRIPFNPKDSTTYNEGGMHLCATDIFYST